MMHQSQMQQSQREPRYRIAWALYVVLPLLGLATNLLLDSPALQLTIIGVILLGTGVALYLLQRSAFWQWAVMGAGLLALAGLTAINVGLPWLILAAALFVGAIVGLPLLTRRTVRKGEAGGF